MGHHKCEMRDGYIWQHEDFPHYYVNEEAVYALELDFKERFESLKNFAQDSDLHEVFTNEVYYNSLIEGVHLNLNSVQNSFYKRELVGNKEERGAIKLFNFALNNYDQVLTHDLLYHMHKLIIDDELAGQYVGDMEIISGNALYHEEEVVYKGVPAAKIDEAMDIFIHRYNKPDQLTPLTNALKCHIHFEQIHPFIDGNGRIGRTLIMMSLCRDFQAKVPLALSQGLLEHVDDYYGLFSNSLDLTEAIKKATPLLINSVNRTMKIVSLTKFKELLDKLDLNARQYKALNTVLRYELLGEFKGGLSNEKYRKINSCDRKMATRDLNQLVTKGLLVKQGDLKSTRYKLNYKDTEKVN